MSIAPSAWWRCERRYGAKETYIGNKRLQLIHSHSNQYTLRNPSCRTSDIITKHTLASCIAIEQIERPQSPTSQLRNSNMCLAILASLCMRGCDNDRPDYTQNARPVQYPQQPQQPQQPPYYSDKPPQMERPMNAPAPPQAAYDPWQGPPGYVSREAGRWRGPLGRRRYESDVQTYGIVEADRKARRRRVAAAASAGAGC